MPIVWSTCKGDGPVNVIAWWQRDYQDDGVTPGEAQQAAVADLGSAMFVNDSLITMHISRNHTLAACWLAWVTRCYWER